MEDNHNNNQFSKKKNSDDKNKQENIKQNGSKKRWQKEIQEYSKFEFNDLINFQYTDTQAFKDIYSYRSPAPKKLSAQ